MAVAEAAVAALYPQGPPLNQHIRQLFPGRGIEAGKGKRKGEMADFAGIFWAWVWGTPPLLRFVIIINMFWAYINIE